MFFLHILPEGGTAGKFPISMRSEDRLEMDIDAWCPIPQKLVAEVTWISTCEWVWPPKKNDSSPNCVLVYRIPQHCQMLATPHPFFGLIIANTIRF